MHPVMCYSTLSSKAGVFTQAFLLFVIFNFSKVLLDYDDIKQLRAEGLPDGVGSY